MEVKRKQKTGSNFLATFKEYRKYHWAYCLAEAKARLRFLEAQPVSFEGNKEIELIIDYFSRLDLSC